MSNTIRILAFLCIPQLAASCAVPWRDPDIAVVEEWARLRDDYDSKAMTLEAALAFLDRVEKQGNAGQTAIAQAHVDDAQAAFDASEAAFTKWERDYSEEKNGPIVNLFANTVGALWPPLQVPAATVGAIVLQLVGGGLASKRVRKHLLKAVKHWSPWTSADGTPFKPIEGALDIGKALGWKHSSEASAAVVEGEAVAVKVPAQAERKTVAKVAPKKKAKKA